MKRRALVIGSQVQGLKGVVNDVATMVEILGARGFEVAERTDANASRAGILEGYRRLIADSAEGDIAAIFYSGHGARALNPNEAGPRYMQCIVPTDWGSGGEFRGILDVELSRHMAQLTTKKVQTAVILDCCHAARMSRDLELVPKAIPRAWVDGVDDFLEKVEIDTSRLYAESNPHAVRLVGSEVDRSAYEAIQDVDGKSMRMGLLTRALQVALREVGNVPTSWRALGMRVRELVLDQKAQQRPEIEGPGDQLVFLPGKANRTDAVVFFYDEGKPALRAGTLLGARPGAVYDIVKPGRSELKEVDIVAEAKVSGLRGAFAHLDLIPRDGAGEPEAGSLAFPRELAFPQLEIALSGDDDLAELQTKIEKNRFLAVAASLDGARFEVLADAGNLSLRDSFGVPMAKPVSNDDAGRDATVTRLQAWARAEAIRDLQPFGLSRRVIDVEWGRVVGGKRIAMAAGDAVHAGERVYIEVKNLTDINLFVGVFDVGISGSVALLSNEAMGTRLGSKDSLLLGDDFGGLVGLETYWPTEVPSDGVRSESFVIIAAESPTDFTVLEADAAARGVLRGGESPLKSLLESTWSGRTRETKVGANEGRYDVKRLDFELSPTPRTPFAVDVAIAPEALGAARSFDEEVRSQLDGAPPDRISLRLNEMVVHKNHAFWRKAKIRVDAVALTAVEDDGSCYRARTELFSNIDDGDRLPLDNLLLFQGQVAKFLDFGIWVSVADNDAKSLPELLKNAVSSSDFESATQSILGLTALAPQAAAVVAAGTAATTLLYLVDQVINGAMSKSVGLYRRSFLSSEHFGLGRYPATGLLRAQDFSFSYTVSRG